MPATKTNTKTKTQQPIDLSQLLWSEDLPRSHGFEPLTVEGKLPDDLRGTLYRNGPGQFGLLGKRYTHPFEADGAITAVRFAGGGRVEGASKLTESAELVEELAAKKMRYGLAAPWPRRVANMLRGKQKNTANTNVLVWQGRLFALMEAARPTELDPQTLAMIGETDLGVVGQMFSAHPHRVESRRAVYNFGLEYGRTTRLHMYELPDEGPARKLGAIELPGPPMLHDFIATETHLVFFVSPVRVHVPRMFAQIGTFRDFFGWRPHLGTEVICVPIDRPAEPVRFAAESFYQWHFTNAFSRGRELVIEYVRYPDFASFYALGEDHMSDALSAGRYHRAVVDLDARTLRSEPLFDGSCEFPTVAPRVQGAAHRFAYMVLGELGGIGKLDTRSGKLEKLELPSTQRVSEPLFVPRPGATDEDDGHLLALSHDGRSDRAFLAVVDARKLHDGPVAKIWFDHRVPITFHGTFAPAPASGRE